MIPEWVERFLKQASAITGHQADANTYPREEMVEAILIERRAAERLLEMATKQAETEDTSPEIGQPEEQEGPPALRPQARYDTTPWRALVDALDAFETIDSVASSVEVTGPIPVRNLRIVGS